MKFIWLIWLWLVGCTLAFSQPKNRLSLGYHQGYVVERNDLAKLGLQAGLERQLSPRWSVSVNWAMEDYCRCDLSSYRLWLREHIIIAGLNRHSSPTFSSPAFSRFMMWSLWTNYSIPIHGSSSRWMIGTGLLHRTGAERFFLARTNFELVFDLQLSRDWAIPIRLAYRYDPPYQRWGLTAFVMYQGYFRYQTSYLGNNPMNVMQAGVTFDLRLGRREKLGD
jgi:hypothetical protein